MFKNKIALFFVALLCLAQSSVAQSSNDSPYTRFGYGDLNDNTSGEQRGMGGVALGSRSKTSINSLNPASYSVMDTMLFMFDVGISGRYTSYKSSLGTNSKIGGNLEYVTMQVPIGRYMGLSAGLQPFSNVGYNYSKRDSQFLDFKIADFDTIAKRTSFSGSGGISQVYAGLAVRFLDHFSIGANVYYMFGTLYNNRTSRYLAKSDSIYRSTTLDVHSFRYRLGLQYFNTITDKHAFNIGLIYEPKMKLQSEYTSATYGANTEYADTLSSDKLFDMPETFGCGINYCYNNRLTLGADYTLQRFSQVRFRGANELQDRSKLAFGLQYIPNSRARQFSKRVSYRAGFNVTTPYYKVNNVTPANNYAMSLGLGLPLYNNVTNSVTMFNATLEYGKIGSVDMLREQYIRLTLNVTFNEHWFFKRKL